MTSKFIYIRKFVTLENIFLSLLSIIIIIIFLLVNKYNIHLHNKESEIINFKNDYKNKKVVEALKAKSYVIMNLDSLEIISAKNETELLPLASLSKVLSIGAYLNFYNEQKIKISPDIALAINKILIKSDNYEMEQIAKDFEKQNQLSLLNIINLYIDKNQISSNDIKIINLTGLDINEKTASNFANAKSFAFLYAQIYNENKSIFENTKFEKITKINKQNKKEEIVNTNPNSENTVGLLSSKTGFTDLAGGNLSVIVSPSPGEKYLIVVLGSSKEGRFEDIDKLNNLLPLLIKSKSTKSI